MAILLLLDTLCPWGSWKEGDDIVGNRGDGWKILGSCQMDFLKDVGLKGDGFQVLRLQLSRQLAIDCFLPLNSCGG